MSAKSSILPSQCRDFMNKSYWEKFFRKIKKEGGDTEFFEWYGEYSSFDHLFKKYIEEQHQVLHVGCGKSLLAEQLYDAKVCKQIINIDFEQKSLLEMSLRSAKLRPEMKFQCFSLLEPNLPLKSQQFDIILDKGTLDAIYPHSLKEINLITQFFNNMSDVLNVGGKYLIISLLQDHILQALLEYFNNPLWYIEIIETVIEKSKLYPFFIVLTKQGKAENEEQKEQDWKDRRIRLSLLNNQNETIQGFQAQEKIKHIQLQNHFITQVHKLRQGQNFTLDLWSSQNKNIPRYTLFIYDSDNPQCLQNKTCGCFIMPTGKENSQIFGTPEGHRELQKQTNMSRFIVARMNTGHLFESLKVVQGELSPAIDQLTPKGCSNRPCPFMADGDEIAGQQYDLYTMIDKKVLYQNDNSVVEEIFGDDDTVIRRVVFKQNIDQTQSQVRVTLVPKDLIKTNQTIINFNQTYQGLLKPKPNQLVAIDHDHLEFQYHLAMVAGLSFIQTKILSNETQVNILILGGGTGSLSQFLTQHFNNLKITNIEISEDMIQVAKEYFEFENTQQETMIWADAFDYVDELQNSHQFDCIIIDINANDCNTPPQNFLSEKFFKKLETLMNPQGETVLMINVVDLNNSIKTLPWEFYYSMKCEDIQNEVYFFPNVGPAQSGDGKIFIDKAKIDRVDNLLKMCQLEKFRKKAWDPVLNIQEYVQQIKLKWPKLQVIKCFTNSIKKQSQPFQVNESNIIKEGEIQEAGQRKDFYQQDLQKIQKKKNNRKKVNKNR